METCSILNIECSMFANAKATTPTTVNLLEWLKSDCYFRQQQEYREELDQDKKRAAKLNMPGITPSGIFSKRGKEYLLQHSRLMGVDIDFKDNKHISNYNDLKGELSKLQNIAYCGLSIRGIGYWLIIPISNPEKHELHFEFIRQYFYDRHINIDKSCKDVSRLRFYSHDPEAYFNHSAKPLQAYSGTFLNESAQPVKNMPERSGTQSFGQNEEYIFSTAQKMLKNWGYVFCEGQKHTYIYKLCKYLRYKGIPRENVESWINNNLMPISEIKSNCISYPYRNW